MVLWVYSTTTTDIAKTVLPNDERAFLTQGMLFCLFLIKAESRQHKRNDQLLSALSLFIQRTVK